MKKEEGNKIIAEFMQSSYINETNNYATNWDWLMSAIEKIESIYDEYHGYFGVHIVSNSCTIQGTMMWKNTDAYHNPITLSNKIESTWHAIVQFIQWYNNK